MKTKFSVLIVLLFIFPCILFSQNAKIKEYTKKLDKAKADEKPLLYYKIADEYFDLDVAKSEEYALEGIKSLKKLTNNLVYANLYALLGAINLQNEEFKTAIKYYDKELEYRQILKDDGDIGLCYFNMASAYENNSNEKKAIDAYEKSLKYAKLAGFKKLTLQIYEALFNLNVTKKKYEEAFNYFKLWVTIKDSTFKIKKNQEIVILRKQKNETEEELKMKDSTLQVLDSTLHVVDSTLTVVDSTLTVVSQEKEELVVLTKEQKLAIQLLNTEKELQNLKIKSQKLKVQILLLSIILLLIVSVFIFQRFWFKRKMNKKLEAQNKIILQQNEEIKTQNEEIKTQNEEIEVQKNTAEQQRDEIAKKNKKITDSITYAQKIQSTIMPQVEIINDYFPENFVFFKPRDIVSGDFYWFSKISINKSGEVHVNENISAEKELFIFTAADCTGHGVPGAFMSMLGISFLNETVFANHVFNADEILNTLRNKIKKALRQTGKMIEQKDGMDMAMCVFDKKKMQLQFAGANNPLLLVRKNQENKNYEIIEYKGDLMPVGIQSENDPPFKLHTVDIRKDDACYIFSDGYFDQFGGPRNKKFLLKNFHQVAINVQEKSMPEQIISIEQTLNEWKGKNEQVDDILIIGVKF